MDKLTVLSTVGVAGAVSSVTGAYMLGAFGDSAYLAKNLDEFKNSGGGTCAQSLFSGLSVEKRGNKLGENSDKVDNNSFNDSGATASTAEGCLIVNGERDNYTVDSNNEKGSGNFRGSWSFKKGNKGFVMFTLAKTSETVKQLDLTGGFYYVSRASETDPGSVKKYYELKSSENKKISSSDFSTNLPSVGVGFEGGKLSTQYPNGGFVSANSDLDNLCQTTHQCLEKPLKKSDGFRGYGTGEFMSSGSSNDLSKGSTNFGNNGWLENMYDKNSKLDLSNVFTSINGKGKEESLKTSLTPATGS